ncbi:MAG: hypothetical protein ABFD64_05870 [Armatimonadota bacterium]
MNDEQAGENMLNDIDSADEQLHSALKELYELLERAKAYHFASYVEKILQLLDEDPNTAMKEAISNNFWGGSGSLFDLILYEENHCLGRDIALRIS